MKHAQASMELIFVISLVFLIFLFLLYLSFTKHDDVSYLENVVKARHTCFTLSNAILGTFLNGNGTVKQVALELNTTIDPINRIISVHDYFVSCTLPINNVINISLTKGTIIIKNYNNYVTLQNV